MYSRSCELAHEVDATLWQSVGACIHVRVNLPGVKCGSSSEEFRVRRSQVVARRPQHCRYPDLGPVLEVVERLLASSHGI